MAVLELDKPSLYRKRDKTGQIVKNNHFSLWKLNKRYIFKNWGAFIQEDLLNLSKKSGGL